MEVVGETDWVCDPLEKVLPPLQPPEAVQDVALPLTVHVRIDDPPVEMVSGLAERVSVGGQVATLQFWLAYVPESVPLLQVLVWDTQLDPQATELDE